MTAGADAGDGFGSEVLHEALRRNFGYEAFRAGQEELIGLMFRHRRALGVFPTGAGKSLCFQLPALMLDGTAIVISPLIALMRDQVAGLRERGLAAAHFDSSLTPTERDQVLLELQSGRLKILYLAPERLAQAAFRKLLRRVKISMVAIDEAHCVAEWGHEFRPDYLKLAGWISRMRVPYLLALTATATPPVVSELRTRFRIRKSAVLRRPSYRANLLLEIRPCPRQEKDTVLREIIASQPARPTIIYVSRRETAEAVHTMLQRNGVKSAAYHAGLSSDTRARAQAGFMNGAVTVIAATTAFGMGIDRPDIGAIIHCNPPRSIESYFQEIGRGGRDGRNAECVWLATGQDFSELTNQIEARQPSEAELKNLVRRILRREKRLEVSLYHLGISCDLPAETVSLVFAYLEIAGWIVTCGGYHDRYRLCWLRPQATVLAGRPSRERALLIKLLATASESRGALRLDLQPASEALGIDRSKVAEIILDLARADDAKLRPERWIQTFELADELPPEEVAVGSLLERFRLTHENQLRRLGDVRELPNARGCLARRLAAHFNERLDGPCGNCSGCRGLPRAKMETEPNPPGSDAEWETIRSFARQRLPALTSPHQLARFLWGQAGPAARAARLMRLESYSSLSHWSFADVLAACTAVIGSGPGR